MQEERPQRQASNNTGTVGVVDSRRLEWDSGNDFDLTNKTAVLSCTGIILSYNGGCPEWWRGEHQLGSAGQ